MKTGICPHCGREINLDYRVGFRETCPGCDGDLHSCVACSFYEPGHHNDCREPRASMVQDKERANRCDWFAWGDNETTGEYEEVSKAKNALEALFKK